MASQGHTADWPDQARLCVIIPTYNNAATLQRVIDGVLRFLPQVIVVNDGSTDRTPEILSSYPQLIRIDFKSNKGKGMALRIAFDHARSLGFEHAVTIDSDGQHFADDLPVFISALQSSRDTIFIGSRNMAQQGVPRKSSFGNKFSNFWFWFETGIRLEDTQSGYRLYPLQRIPRKYFTRKFEFEIEVIVRSAWKGIPVVNVPVKILYDPDERVSHFRPFRDFTRISILNTVLVLITLLYIKPRDVLQKLRRKGLRKFMMENVLEADDSNAVKSCSIALGVFTGIAPFWGFQTVIVLFLAAVFRLNKAIAFIFSNVSIPPMIPFIIYASLWIGHVLLGRAMPMIPQTLSRHDLGANLAQYLVGSLALAAISAVVCGLVAYCILQLLTIFKRKS